MAYTIGPIGSPACLKIGWPLKGKIVNIPYDIFMGSYGILGICIFYFSSVALDGLARLCTVLIIIFFNVFNHLMEK